MTPFDALPVPVKWLIGGVSAPLATVIASIPGDINPWLQSLTLLSATLVSVLTAVSIFKKLHK